MLYLYGIIDSPEPIYYTCSGRNIYTLAYNDISALVSRGDGPMTRVTGENVIIHGEVLNGIVEKQALLPVRFGTLLGGGDVEGLLSRNYHQFLASLNEVRGMVEMSVRALWNAAEEEEKCRQGNDFSDPREDLPGNPGTLFLMQKRRQLLLERCLKSAAGIPADEIHGWLSRAAVKHIKRVLPSPAMFFHGSYMINRERAGDFAAEFSSLRDKFTRYKFLLSGPWPLYSFVSLNCR
ncbi:gas vesicle synthesis GvpLGvpF [Desulfocucumis palustris]|uniref:Gas vesicle synthesis GvpLGvpF n=1 Tax=Desulfocucumis palustris TaxID=1898651 RepID=A0A2L2XDY6_9FIRM|nr:GvpL/GvpF family gas vesicle protein [Desulfocucumis palustris]GBF32446.1 gas vesicle synthesis GvpLGvpF [Desulfocucumis palustris]